MLIVCKQCQAEYELDPPAVPFARDQDLVFRCSSCGTSIPIRTDTEADDESVSPTDVPVQAHSGGFVLRQEGQTYNVGDTAMLQRWIVERRVGADDEISEDGGPFLRVGDNESFRIFFQLVQDVEQTAAANAAFEVPTPAFVGKANSKKLFSRPSGVNIPEIGHSTDDSAPKLPAATAPKMSPQSPPESEPETEVAPLPDAGPELEPATEEAQFGEVIPDEAPVAFSDSLLDEPTMDMELGQDDFFSEEETVIADRVLFEGDEDAFGEDDDLEWGQTRRKSMAMWWLIFFGGLGGAGYFTLDLISQPGKEPVATVASEAAETPPVALDQKEEKADTGAPTPDTPAPSEAPSAEGAEEGSATAPGAEGSTPEAEVPSPKPVTPSPKEPDAVAKKAVPPSRPNAEREVNRGWVQIDNKNWSKARNHFSKALSVAPGSVDGRYGMAYVNEHQGRVAEAVSQYCRLVKTTTGEIQSEVSGRLRTLDKECP